MKDFAENSEKVSNTNVATAEENLHKLIGNDVIIT